MAIGDCVITLSQQDADIGDLVRITARFTDADNEPADPTSVSILVREPNGNESTMSVSNPSVGVYYAEQSIDASNCWWFRAKGTGTIEAAVERVLMVRATGFDAP